MHQYKGRLIVHTGSMFSGKTSSLEGDVKRFSIAGYQVLVFKPSLDTRCGADEILSHDKKSTRAYALEDLREIYDYLKEKEVQVVAIDEVQFLKNPSEEVVEILTDLCSQGITVIVAGLDMDFEGRPFEITKELMPVADYLHKHHAVCTGCGADAWVSHRKTKDKSRVVLGATEEYEPLCRACYEKIEKRN